MWASKVNPHPVVIRSGLAGRVFLRNTRFVLSEQSLDSNANLAVFLIIIALGYSPSGSASNAASGSSVSVNNVGHRSALPNTDCSDV
jgi:hypothetical protein